MPRKKERKSAKGLFSDVAMREALTHCLKKGMKISASAKKFGIDRCTLRRYVKRYENVDHLPDDISLAPHYQHTLVFSKAQEQELVDYLLLRSSLGYGLTASEFRMGAVDFAKHNKIKMPKNWEEKCIAGMDWYLGFMKRHPVLSTRKPEQCSVARAACFNKVNIDNYFDKLDSVIQRHPEFIDGSRKWNLDETGTSTVAAVKEKLIAPRGQKQVHQMKGHERGTSVTTCCFINALGQSIPPVMIFPRKNFQNSMLVGAYPGTLGLANKAGYMTNEMFLPTIKHFIKHTKSSIEHPTLLIVDNVGCHLTLECINLCKESGVTLFTLPPHTTHRTQPLDVGVYGPFQTAYDKAVQQWTYANPGIPPSIYQIANFVNIAWSKSASPANIISAFRATGIHPFNRNIFNEETFLPSLVTHQETESNEDSGAAGGEEAELYDLAAEQELDDVHPVSDLSNDTAGVNPTSSESISATSNTPGHRSAIEVFGLPKAKPKQTNRKPRRKGRCMVATDTPEKNIIEERELLKKLQEDEKQKRKELREQKKLENKGKEKNPRKKPKRIVFEEAKIDDPVEESRQNDNEAREEEQTFQPLSKDPEEGDYVLVEFPLNATEKKYYVGKVLASKNLDGDLEISYLRKSVDKFVLPQVPDLQSVHINDVKMLLPKPTASGTRRQKNMLQFANVKLDHLKMG